MIEFVQEEQNNIHSEVNCIVDERKVLHPIL